MRCLLEVIATGIEIAKFPRRNGGGTDEVPFVWISGVDADFMDQLIKIKVFRPKNLEGLKALGQKGSRLAIKFRTLKRDDKFEHCTVMTVNEDDVQPFVQAGAQAAQAEQPAMALAA